MISSPLKLMLVASVAFFAMSSGTHAQAPKVVVTLKPIHSLVAGVMEGVAEPELLMPGGGSPHAYALRPSQARSLAKAVLVVRVSEYLESFLNRSIENLAQEARILTLDKTGGLTLHKGREGGIWEHHELDQRHEEHGAHGDRDKQDREQHGTDDDADDAHGGQDPHIWLDPENAIKLTQRISDTLSDLFPQHRAAFAANALSLRQRLEALDRELMTVIKEVRGKPYIVFHDAYRYFEEHYGLRPVGAVTISPDRLPGARRLVEIRSRIQQQRAVCVFAEPQFRPRIVSTLTEGTKARHATLDPLGAKLPPGPDLYFALMRNLAKNLKDCLAPASQ